MISIPHQATGQEPQLACWQIGHIRVSLTWRPPLELLSVTIAADETTAGVDSESLPPALLAQACEVLLQRLGLDDPLLAALMPTRLALLERLARPVRLTDQRQTRQDGKVAILRTTLTT